MSGFFSNAFGLIGRTIQQVSHFRALPTSITSGSVGPTTATKPWSLDFFRSYQIIFKASERKRIKTHGWRARLKTKNGRRILMRRILKGRYYISH